MPDENTTPGTGENESPQTVGENADLGLMLTELCQEIRNWFEREKYFGVFSVIGGELSGDVPLADGQYYRVIGSIFNDGIHRFGYEAEGELTDETFDGSVWALAIPKPVINLAAEIAEWRAANEKSDSPAMSPFMSESFGGYSYTKGSAFSNAGSGGMVSWKTAFAGRMNAWRKL